MNKKPFLLVTSFLSLLTAANVIAAYDKSYYIGDSWSGEYPRAFTVLAEDVTVKGRKAMDKDSPANVECQLPRLAVFSPWNNKRNELSQVDYKTASKIVKLTAKHDFVFESSDEKSIKILKGDVIEYLMYGAEGIFSVRINGKEYDADESLFENVEEVSRSQFSEDQWLKLKCENNQTAWLFLDDLIKEDKDGNVTTPKGIIDGRGVSLGYGEARDLTEAEAKDLASNP